MSFRRVVVFYGLRIRGRRSVSIKLGSFWFSFFGRILDFFRVWFFGLGNGYDYGIVC